MKKYILFSFISLICFQCKTEGLGVLKKSIDDSYPRSFNGYILHKSRDLLYESLSPSIMHNDTIILLERFDSSLGNYWCTIYESNNKVSRSYITHKNIKNGKIYVDSLSIFIAPDKILKMARQNKLNEIKRRGDSTTITPAATLIINIGIKEKEKFNFSTLITQEF